MEWWLFFLISVQAIFGSFVLALCIVIIGAAINQVRR